MEPVLAHFESHWPTYAIAAAIVIPLIYFTRKWTLPLIQWTLELCIYAVIFHVVIHYLTEVAEWFQFESQMKMLKDQRVHAGWETPLLYFWKLELYKPSWVFYIEVVFLVAAVILMIRLRPMATQRKLPKREVLRKGQAPQVRPPGKGAGSKGR